jgi:hypothetical protein
MIILVCSDGVDSLNAAGSQKRTGKIQRLQQLLDTHGTCPSCFIPNSMPMTGCGVPAGCSAVHQDSVEASQLSLSIFQRSFSRTICTLPVARSVGKPHWPDSPLTVRVFEYRQIEHADRAGQAAKAGNFLVLSGLFSDRPERVALRR